MDTLPVVFILGPTASGKTAVGMELSRRFDCSLISVDSSLVYRGLNIGTAKPTPQELSMTPHALVDICDPWNSYSAARFVADAAREIALARTSGRVPVLLGGTMLYFRALENGLAEMPSADESIRATITARAKLQGWDSIHAELEAVDPVAAKKIHPNDPQRIQRALEVWQLTGRRISDMQATGEGNNLAPLIKTALFPQDRPQLHQRISTRFHQMIEDGFLDEVRGLIADPRIHADLPAMRSVGYRQALEYLDGSLDEATFQDKAIIATRQLAKRQFTWLRSMNDLQCFDSLSVSPEFVAAEIQRMIEL